MADIMFSIFKVEWWNKDATNPDWEPLGVTKGGATFTQSIEKLDITSDQSGVPITKIVVRAPKTLRLNLLDASLDNLALAFGGEKGTGEASNVVKIPALISGVERKLKITTKPVNNTYYEITIERGLVTGESELSMTPDDASGIPLNVKVLTPSSDSEGEPLEPVTIEKKTGTPT